MGSAGWPPYTHQPSTHQRKMSFPLQIWELQLIWAGELFIPAYSYPILLLLDLLPLLPEQPFIYP